MKSVLSLGAVTAACILAFNGCSVEDEVKDLVQPNNIFVVNGTGGTIHVTTNVEKSDYVSAHNKNAYWISITGHSNVEVSYDGGHMHKFGETGGAYLYAATHCNDQGYLTDHTDGNRVHVVNLTSQRFTDNVTVIDADGKTFTLTDDINPCSVIDSSSANTIKIGNGMQIKIGNGNWETITGIPSDIVSIANKVRVDVVVYSTTDGTIVPMAGYDDLN